MDRWYHRTHRCRSRCTGGRASRAAADARLPASPAGLGPTQTVLQSLQVASLVKSGSRFSMNFTPRSPHHYSGAFARQPRNPGRGDFFSDIFDFGNHMVYSGATSDSREPDTPPLTAAPPGLMPAWRGAPPEYRQSVHCTAGTPPRPPFGGGNGRDHALQEHYHVHHDATVRGASPPCSNRS